MDIKDRLDPELLTPLKDFNELTNGGLNLNDIAATRIVLHDLFSAIAAELVFVDDVTCENQVVSVDNMPEVPVRIYRPINRPEPLPALLWIHGGGYVLGSAEQDDMKAKNLAHTIGCVVVSVDYRLAPEFPFPAPLDDCYTALKWLSTHCDRLGIDLSRIAIAGASAGAGLAAGLGLLVRDRGEINLVFQMLIYPMIDDLNVTSTNNQQSEHFIWNNEANRLGWKAYLGSLYGKDDVPYYAAPIRAKDLSGLAPTYMCVGELDLFLNENIDYARRLLDAGVSTEFHIYPGVYHGFEGIAPDADVSKRFIKERDHALISAFRNVKSDALDTKVGNN